MIVTVASGERERERGEGREGKGERGRERGGERRTVVPPAYSPVP